MNSIPVVRLYTSVARLKCPLKLQVRLYGAWYGALQYYCIYSFSRRKAWLVHVGAPAASTGASGARESRGRAAADGKKEGRGSADKAADSGSYAKSRAQ